MRIYVYLKYTTVLLAITAAVLTGGCGASADSYRSGQPYQSSGSNTDAGSTDSGSNTDAGSRTDAGNTDSGSNTDAESRTDAGSTDSGSNTDAESRADSGIPERISGAVIPDLQSFSNNMLYEYEVRKEKDFIEYIYFLKYNEEFVDEYLNLLKNGYNFKLRDYHEIVDIDSYEYSFDYTGPEAVTTFSVDTSGMDCNNIAVYFWDLHAARDPSEIHIRIGNGIQYVDNRERTSQVLDRYEEDNGGSGGGGSSGGDDSSIYIPDFAKLDCPICEGSGDCTECGGDGYLWSLASDKEDRNCWKCGGSGRCSYCNGSGKR